MERNVFDPNQPQQSMSLANMRNVLRALFQGDLMPLRARAFQVLDEMEYATDALAQANWAGTGVTVTKTTTKQEGTYALQCVIDATDNRKISKTQALNLSAFKQIKIWERVNVASSAIQFYLKDGSGNESYWNITTNGTLDTWQQDVLDLTIPDSNNGTNAILSAIVEWGFLGLDASKTYIFDTIKAFCGLCVAVEGAAIGDAFYRNVYLGVNNMTFAGGPSPTISPPAANPRIDLLVLNNSNALVWVTGTEASSPAEPEFPTDKIPICLVYCKTTMAKVVDYEDKDANPNEAYIYRDVRPLFMKVLSSFISLIDCPTTYSGKGNYRVHVNSGATALEFILDKFITLVDCPATYVAQALKLVRVAAGETALEFWTLLVDLATMVTDILGTAHGGTGSSANANAANGVVMLNASSQLPAVSGALLTNLPAPSDASITQVKLKTATGEVSANFGVNVTLPGGEYGFYPLVKKLGSGSFHPTAIIGRSIEFVSYVANIANDGASGSVLAAWQRYVTASGKDHWIFLLIDKITKQIIASYQAPDHPCANQGGATELDIPHPFNSYDPEKHEIVLVDNDILNIAKVKINRRRSLLIIINEDFIIDDTKRPIFESREIIKINEYPQESIGTVIARIKTPEWAKILIQADEITLEQIIIENLPKSILYKKMALKE